MGILSITCVATFIAVFCHGVVRSYRVASLWAALIVALLSAFIGLLDIIQHGPTNFMSLCFDSLMLGILGLAIAFLVGILFVLYHRWTKPIPVGCCQSCSYNLTGNTSGICPECGTAI